MRQSTRVQQLPLPEREGFDAIFDGKYLEEIPAQLEAWNCSRVLLVVSKTMEATTPYISNLELKLGSRVIGKKSGVGQHSVSSGFCSYFENTVPSNYSRNSVENQRLTLAKPYADVIDIAHRIQKQNIDVVISSK